MDDERATRSVEFEDYQETSRNYDWSRVPIGVEIILGASTAEEQDCGYCRHCGAEDEPHRTLLSRATLGHRTSVVNGLALRLPH